MTPCVAYMRCSGKGQIDGDTWERQIAAIRSCAETKQYEIIHEYREEGISGKTDEESRPAFQAMISELLGNGCRIIVVESLDRLARQYDVQQQLATYIASKGIALISANTGEDITAALMGDPMRRALVQIQGIFAELDKNLTVAKLRKARDRKKQQNGRCEGVRGFGEDPKRPWEKPVLDYILELRNQGKYTDSIAEILESRHMMTRSGEPWRGSVIRRIVKRHVKARSQTSVGRTSRSDA